MFTELLSILIKYPLKLNIEVPNSYYYSHYLISIEREPPVVFSLMITLISDSMIQKLDMKSLWNENDNSNGIRKEALF